MSRNLSITICYFCDDRPVLLEPPRPITKRDAGVYFSEYANMLVANATCPGCSAEYLAWMYDIPGRRHRKEGGIQDLSFRSTFDDEPGIPDLPIGLHWDSDGWVTYYKTHQFDAWAKATETRSEEARLHVEAARVLET